MSRKKFTYSVTAEHLGKKVSGEWRKKKSQWRMSRILLYVYMCVCVCVFVCVCVYVRMCVCVDDNRFKATAIKFCGDRKSEFFPEFSGSQIIYRRGLKRILLDTRSIIEEMTRNLVASAGVSLLQHTATQRNILPHTATHCHTLQCIPFHTRSIIEKMTRNFVASAGVSLLQHTATHCNTLQQTATHCNRLPHTATHSEPHCNTLQCILLHTLHN